MSIDVTEQSVAAAAAVDALLAARTAHSRTASSRTRSTAAFAARVAARLDLSPAQVAATEHTALLYDIGSVGIPDRILHKVGPLSDDDWSIMHTRPVIGARILSGLLPLAHLATYVRATHERWDGTGYPDGLRGNQIPIAARITHACVSYYAMTSDRPYRKALGRRWAVNALRDHAGTQFDPRVVEAIVAVLEQSDRNSIAPPDQSPAAAAQL